MADVFIFKKSLIIFIYTHSIRYICHEFMQQPVRESNSMIFQSLFFVISPMAKYRWEKRGGTFNRIEFWQWIESQMLSNASKCFVVSHSLFPIHSFISPTRVTSCAKKKKKCNKKKYIKTTERRLFPNDRVAFINRNMESRESQQKLIHYLRGDFVRSFSLSHSLVFRCNYRAAIVALHESESSQARETTCSIASSTA